MFVYILTASSFSSSVSYQCFDRLVLNSRMSIYCTKSIGSKTTFVCDASMRYLLYARGVNRKVFLDHETFRRLHLAKTELGFELIARLLLRAINQLVGRRSYFLARNFWSDFWPQKGW